MVWEYPENGSLTIPNSGLMCVRGIYTIYRLIASYAFCHWCFKYASFSDVLCFFSFNVVTEYLAHFHGISFNCTARLTWIFRPTSNLWFFCGWVSVTMSDIYPTKIGNIQKTIRLVFPLWISFAAALSRMMNMIMSQLDLSKWSRKVSLVWLMYSMVWLGSTFTGQEGFDTCRQSPELCPTVVLAATWHRKNATMWLIFKYYA